MINKALYSRIIINNINNILEETDNESQKKDFNDFEFIEKDIKIF